MPPQWDVWAPKRCQRIRAACDPRRGRGGFAYTEGSTLMDSRASCTEIRPMKRVCVVTWVSLAMLEMGCPVGGDAGVLH